MKCSVLGWILLSLLVLPAARSAAAESAPDPAAEAMRAVASLAGR